MSQYEDRYKHESYSHKKKSGLMGEVLGEVPIIGELFESLGGGRIGRKGVKKIACCCAPLALILLVPLIMFVYWLVKSSLSLFQVNLPNVDWIEQAKNWLTNTFQLDQITGWVGQFQALQGLFGQ